jgi:hypothetical protein
VALVRHEAATTTKITTTAIAEEAKTTKNSTWRQARAGKTATKRQ